MKQGNSGVTGDHPAADTKHLPERCQKVSQILARIGDKWSVLVVMLLGDGPLRFNELKRKIGGVSQRMLTLTLRGLERDGLVKRTMFATIPPRVEYELTDLGRSLREPVEKLGLWAFANEAQIDEARKIFDQKTSET
ncbi:MAG: winged helix-turn-helix transcriptional regulator [Methylovirgula sp.]